MKSLNKAILVWGLKRYSPQFHIYLEFMILNELIPRVNFSCRAIIEAMKFKIFEDSFFESL